LTPYDDALERDLERRKLIAAWQTYVQLCRDAIRDGLESIEGAIGRTTELDRLTARGWRYSHGDAKAEATRRAGAVAVMNALNGRSPSSSCPGDDRAPTARSSRRPRLSVSGHEGAPQGDCRSGTPGRPIRFEEWICWEIGVGPIGARKPKKGCINVIHGPGLVRYPRCAKDLHGWSWEYRGKQRRIVQRRVAVVTYVGGKEPAPWTREDEAREQVIRDAEFRGRALITELAEPVAEEKQPEEITA
jgi:hypothetical protein